MGEPHRGALQPPGPARQREIEVAAPGTALGRGAQRLRGAGIPLEREGEVEGTGPEEIRHETALAGPDPVEQGEQRGRRGRGEAAGDPACPVRADPAGEGGVRAGKVRHLQAVDDEARPVGLDARRDDARVGRAVAHVAGLQGQAEIVAVQGGEGRVERRQRRDVDAARRDLRLEAAARRPLGGGVAGIAGDPRRPEGEAQVAQVEARQGSGDVGAGLDRAPVQHGHRRPGQPDPPEIAAEPLRARRREADRTVEMERRRGLDGAARAEHGPARGGGAQRFQHQAAAAVEGGGEGEVRPFGRAEGEALDGEIEVEQHGQGASRLRQSPREEGLPLGRGQEAVEIEPSRLQGQGGPPLAQIEVPAAREPKRASARIDLGGDRLEPDLRAGRLEASGEGQGQVSPRNLARRPDDEAGAALRLHRPTLAGAAAGLQAQAGLGLEAGMLLAAARELDRDTVLGERAAGQPERHPAARAVHPPGAGQRRGLEAQVLRVELVGAAGRRDAGGEQELLDLQILDGEVPARERRRQIGRDEQRLVPRHRQPQFGPADPRLGEAELAAQKREERHLGLHEAGVEVRALRALAEMQPVDAQAWRGQEPHLQPPLAADGQAERARDRLVHHAAIGRPIDQRRHGERGHEEEDDGARERGQEVTHRSRSACGPSAGDGFLEGGLHADRARSFSPRAT
ncbi:hypothetical protein MET9862_04343 [Methylobacterium symbioticum]|uniref:Uncharacterized protein n=1 Tax=Methylobacterium symbioticum TaxID=2584084 RepID=A0A509EJ73_9HYPH|nr:hypothetical protein MET9862_04343 [Methylobacterium symbioticum]